MASTALHSNDWRAADAAFLGLTLVASAIHFADNALRLDVYPGPAWFTRDGVLAAWPVVLLLALLAYWRASRTALLLYALVGFAGFAHYLAPHSHGMPTRCIVTVAAEASASLILIVYALLRPPAKAVSPQRL